MSAAKLLTSPRILMVDDEIEQLKLQAHDRDVRIRGDYR
jgi:hypothetical protein